MEFAEFRDQVRAGEFKPSYLLNRFSLAETGKALQMLEEARREPTAEVLRESFDAPEQVSNVLVSARSHPMWGEHKLLVLSKIEDLAAKGLERVRNALVAYLRDPSPWATLVMVSGKDTTRTGGLASLVRRVSVVNPPKLTGTKLASWVRRVLGEAKLDIEPDALQMLLQVCREDWTTIENELNKIVAAFPPGSVVGVEALQFVVEPRWEESVFSLLRLLAAGQTGETLETMDSILRMGRSGHDRLIQLWYWLYRQSRELLAAMEVDARKRKPDILEAVGVNPRAQTALRRQLKGVPKSRLREMLQSLEQVDRQLKSSYTTQPRILLERYVIRLGLARIRRY